MFLICLLLIGLIALTLLNEKESLSVEQIELVPIRVIDEPVETQKIQVK